ncbi:DNA-directed RNA polymerase subunit alpha [Mycoplasma todarodis]|uniref:DNA-directed RNA polymerase subunit alpha n=1 Tax=Mycoplasma todarodis TaxID=1937191 RepID=UPI003B37C9DF
MEKFMKLAYSEIKKQRISEYETAFTIQPLERGFANTLGNAIRRVLLSSVTGVAPFATKIAGVSHEFQTLANVEEDVVQLILNLKELKFTYNPEIIKDGEIYTISIKSPKGEVTAADLVLPVGMEIVDPTQHIATVSKAKALELELFVRSGRGFVGFDKNKDFVKTVSTQIETKLTSGNIIAIDSDFSPIKQVAYETRELNSSAPIIQEALEFKIKTNGSVEAKDALAQAANILMSHLAIMQDISNLDAEEVFEEAKKAEENSKSLSLSISSLDLSVRSYNSLKRAGYNKVADISNLTLSELENIKNLGKKSVSEIIEKLETHGITFKEGDE